jgi:hypothetical protein
VTLKLSIADLINDKQLKQISEDIFEQRVRDIKAGRVIKRSYSPYTVAARKRAGLQTSYVDLTGNFIYSKKHWRLFNTKEWYQTKVKTYNKFIFRWIPRRAKAKTQFKHLKAIYGDFV